MMRIRLPGWFGALLALTCLTSMLTSASRLNSAWLVPTGNIKVDYKALAKPELKVCALTFDDGPDTKYTPAVAAILKRYNVRATFFVVGRQVDANPKGLSALVEAGFEIGNHTQSHPDMSKLGGDKQAAQMSQLQKTLGKQGVTPRWFRPPYGAFNSTTVKTASKLGLETVLWSVDPRDWAEPGVEKITASILKGTVPGAVILLHSTHGQTVQALPGIIEGLQKKGYSFVTMSEWQSAVTGRGLSLPAAASPLAESGSTLPADKTPQPVVAAETDSPPAAESEQGAPRLLPPFEPRGDSVDPAADPAPAAAPVVDEEVIESAPGLPEIRPEGNSGPPLAVATHANFEQPEQLAGIAASQQGQGWHSSSSDLQEYGGVAGYLEQLNPQLFTKPTAVPEASVPTISAISAYDLQGPSGWGSGAWQAETELVMDAVLEHEHSLAENRFRPAPRFYLYGLGSFDDTAVWEQLAAYQQLAQLDGLLAGGQLALSQVPSVGPQPRAAATGLSADAVVDPGLQGAQRVLQALQAGYNNVYIAVRPSNLAGFTPDNLGRGQQELLLLRRLVQGMDFDTAPENDFARQWALPAGVRMARFFDPQHEVLALYCTDGSCDALGLPAAAHNYRVATLSSDQQLLLSPVTMTSVELGRNVLLLYRELPE